MIKKELEKFGKKYITFLFLIIVISGCNTRHEICEDTVLEEFSIDDEALDSVILSVLGNRDGAFPDINKDTGKVLSLNLHYRDSVILFVFLSRPSKSLFMIFLGTIIELLGMPNIQRKI